MKNEDLFRNEVYFSKKKYQSIDNKLIMPNSIYNSSSNFSTKNTDFTQNKSEYKKIFNSSGPENVQVLPIAMNIKNKLTQIPKINLNFNININCDKKNQEEASSSLDNIEVMESIYETVTNIEDNEIDKNFERQNEISKIYSPKRYKLETLNKDDHIEINKQISSRTNCDTYMKSFTYPWTNTKISEIRFDLKKQIDLDFLRHNYKFISVKVKFKINNSE